MEIFKNYDVRWHINQIKEKFETLDENVSWFWKYISTVEKVFPTNFPKLKYSTLICMDLIDAK